MNEALKFADELKRLYANERKAMVDFLLALVEFDRRRLYLELGYNSLWKFCLEGLHLGEGATNLRTRAVGLLQRFPSLVEPLRDGRLTLSSLCELGKVLTAENITSTTRIKPTGREFMEAKRGSTTHPGMGGSVDVEAASIASEPMT